MEKVDMLLEPVRMFLVHIGDFLPKLLLALAIIAAGWVIAKAVKFAVDRGLRAVNFHIVTEKAGSTRSCARAAATSIPRAWSRCWCTGW